ncbi:hypothetical protein PVAP13_2NG258500 [Panicum virgatum]|uniref:Uncharacterized protein n=1 Tax=Panicum virgatum TaxID=38727 RepID=A0A8T0VMB6_PANVG|nr:hypothetical protein PVAP13_2NG258500 [Panicum virgatum]
MPRVRHPLLPCGPALSPVLSRSLLLTARLPAGDHASLRAGFELRRPTRLPACRPRAPRLVLLEPAAARSSLHTAARSSLPARRWRGSPALPAARRSGHGTAARRPRRGGPVARWLGHGAAAPVSVASMELRCSSAVSMLLADLAVPDGSPS